MPNDQNSGNFQQASRDTGMPANPSQEAIAIRKRLLQTYDAEVLEFVSQRLEFGVPESKIVDQLLSHSFSKPEAECLVQDLASDPDLKVTRVTDHYERELLDMVADQVLRGVPEEAIVRILVKHDIERREARRLVDCMTADPELHLRTKEAISSEVGIGFWFLGSGVFCFLLGASAAVAMLIVGRIYFVAMGIAVALMVWGPVQFALGVARMSFAKARRAQ